MLNLLRGMYWALAFTVMAGCSNSDSGTDPDDDDGTIGAGTFRAAVTGGAEFTVEGIAAFASSAPGANPSGFLLQLGGMRNGVSNASAFAFYRVGAKRPGTGTLQIQDAAAVVLSQNGLYAQYTGPEGGIASQSGSLTITSSSSGRLQGSATFTGTMQLLSGGTVNVTVSVTFDATCSNQCD